MSTKKLIGRVMVDSGQIFITDPCLLDDWEPGDYERGQEPDNSYARVCSLTSSQRYGETDLGVAISTHGDGIYPVYVTEDETGRAMSVEIVLTREWNGEQPQI